MLRLLALFILRLRAVLFDNIVFISLLNRSGDFSYQELLG
jgi:hypothetical protein